MQIIILIFLCLYRIYVYNIYKVELNENEILSAVCCEGGVPPLSIALWNASADDAHDTSISSDDTVVSESEIIAIGDEESNVMMDTDDPDDGCSMFCSLSMKSSRSDRVSGDGGIDNNGADLFASST